MISTIWYKTWCEEVKLRWWAGHLLILSQTVTRFMLKKHNCEDMSGGIGLAPNQINLSHKQGNNMGEWCHELVHSPVTPLYSQTSGA